MLTSFAPVYRTDARIIVLGSMPGNASLDADQYYAHPRNQFWPMMARVFQFDLADTYAERLLQLKEHRCALWDALKHCEREGSLDSSIQLTSEVPNDFVWLLDQLPQLELIIFNGKKAEQSFKKHRVALLEPRLAALRTECLPSTSPANASLSFDAKYLVWSETIREG